MDKNLMAWRKRLVLALLWAPVLAGAADVSTQPAPLQAVTSLDVPRYMGRWYELAHYPNRFQSQCVADTSAQYDLLPDGHVQVTNRCRQKDGQMDQAVGMARQVGGANSPKLKVRFAPAWLGFLPFVWGDYWVIDLDEAYQLVAVSEPKREYLWILSRTPHVPAASYTALVQRLQAMGFDTGRLEVDVQQGE